MKPCNLFYDSHSYNTNMFDRHLFSLNFSFINLIQGDQPLPDEAFSASTYSNSYFSPKNARLLPTTPSNSGGSWSPKISNKDQYLQIDLGHQEPVYGVIVAGSPLYDEYVTSYQVLYSPDGVSYSYVTDISRNPEVSLYCFYSSD